MKKPANKRKTTTVSCDESAREFIAAEATRTGKLQREVLAEIISVYQQQQKRSATKEKEQELRKESALELFQEIKNTLDKNIRRDDSAIAFIKTQESKILSPMAAKLDSCESLLNTLVGIMRSFESNIGKKNII